MPTEIVIALIILAATCIGGAAKLITAMVDRRVKKLQNEAEDEKLKVEQERLDREQKRTIEMEVMRRETAKAQADAEEAKATNQSLNNLSSAVLQFMETYRAEQHANQSEMSNQAQSIGDVIQSVDYMAKNVLENNDVTRAAGAKVEAMAGDMNRLHNRLTTIFPSEDPITTIFEQFKQSILEAIERHHLTPGNGVAHANGVDADANGGDR